jgi:hypothetical protein
MLSQGRTIVVASLSDHVAIHVTERCANGGKGG